VDERQVGFSLIEMAIVMVIIGILAGGGISIMGTLTEKRARDECRDYLQSTQQALLSYVNINGALPWASSSTDGTSDSGVSSGYLPYLDLRLRPTDSYGRVLKYSLNSALATDRQATCNTLAAGLSGAPTIVDADGSTSTFPVAFALISAGPSDADSDGDVFDQVNSGAIVGNNESGSPNYIRHPPTETFDDLATYVSEGRLYEATECGGIQTYTLSIVNQSAQEIFLHDVTYPSHLVCLGRIAGSAQQAFKVEAGDAIDIRDDLDYATSNHVDSTPVNTPRPVDSALTLYVN
jgi:prepilin-type N-terminal cleavage/methylation domain-containing protein